MAFALFLTFIGIAVIGRMSLQQIRTGDHGFRMAKSSAPLREVLPGSLFVLSFLFCFGLLVLAQLGLVVQSRFDSPWLNAVTLEMLGGFVGFAGIAITLVAQLQMQRSWRIGVDQSEQTDLITGGLYAHSRNPIYFGIGCLWIGLGLSFLHPAMWLCAAINWISIELVVRNVEEPYLRRNHGEAYLNYCNRTHRFWIFNGR